MLKLSFKYVLNNNKVIPKCLHAVSKRSFGNQFIVPRNTNMSRTERQDSGTENDKTNHNMEPAKPCKIIIIGAGMAGLSAANHLLKNDINDFVILEGRNRVGGRIVAITIGKFLFPWKN